MAQWPSAELKPPGPIRARIGSVLWWLLFALAVGAVVGGAWSGIEKFRSPSGFDRVGLTASSGPCLTVTPSSHLAQVAWPRDMDSSFGACLVKVGGTPVDESASPEAVEPLLDGPNGSRVKVVLADLNGTQAEAEFVRSPVVGWFTVGVLGGDTLAAALYLIAALLLWRRRPFDPVSRRMSFAFLLMAHVGTGAIAFWGASQLHYLLAGIGVLMMIVTLPAYPNGVYVPRAARWLRVVVPVALPLATVAMFAILAVPESEAGLILMGLLAVGLGLMLLVLLAAGLILLLVRYLRMPEGREKQQVKWAALGLSGGFFLMFVGLVIRWVATTTQPDMLALLAGDVVGELGFGLIPAGVAASLLEYRLNDADAAVGKSLGYAIVTVVVGVVWAIVQSVVSDFAKSWAGSPAATTAITTVIAALVFTPARAYVLSWTEAKFQPALVHLRKLPGKLVRWQTCDTPDELAEAALADLVDGVGAAYAAVLGDDGREWRVLGAQGIEPDTAAAQLALERPDDRAQDPFPIRHELAEQLDKPDLLAIGPRSDGASYTRDEKSAIVMIVEPLSNALQAAALRERHIRVVEKSLAGIDRRLKQIERELFPPEGKAPSRP